ncbi:MAG TPA: thioredoxin domain-containing protein [Acidimicrobiales bacterium]|nr:thioredoxin domain-containing protein [Acidimicrobiales bacterium]
MERLAIAAVLVVAAVAVAWALRRRRPAAPTQPRWPVPGQIDRADFDRPDAPWLVAVFTSATCQSCEAALATASVLASEQVAVQDVSFQTNKHLHRRYSIEAAPTIVVADRDGVVQASFVGPPSATDLWAAMADLRR